MTQEGWPVPVCHKKVLSVYMYITIHYFFVNNGFFKLFVLRGFSIFQEKKKKKKRFLVFLLDLLDLILFQYNFNFFSSHVL